MVLLHEHRQCPAGDGMSVHGLLDCSLAQLGDVRFVAVPQNGSQYVRSGHKSPAVNELLRFDQRRQPVSSTSTMPRLIAYSSERSGDIRMQLGAANYSYRFAEDALVRLFDLSGYRTEYISEPQIFKHPATYAGLLGAAPADVLHIAFRSTENIRPMAGARNVCHFAWEFDVMKDRGLVADSILRNQIHMLGLMDEIWVACEFSKTVLQRYGLPNVHVVPAPVVDEDVPARLGLAEALEYLQTVPVAPLLLSGALSREYNAALLGSRIAPLGAHPALACKRAGLDSRIFLAVANPGDLRKNLLNLIEGFQIAADPQSSDMLLVKLIVPNKGNFREEALYQHLLPRCNGDAAYDDPRVVFMVDYLTDLQMDALFSLADYYVSPTHCEGFNRPLLQAMSFGTVPVSTCNTAMTDYITPANAILIREVPYVGIIPGMAGDVAGVPYEVSFASRFDIARALRAAMRQAPDEHAAMADQSRSTVLKKYGLAEIRRSAEARVAALLGQPVDAAHG